MSETKPTVPDVLPQVWRYRDTPGNCTGGSLHIVLDDGNVEDGHVRHCLDYATAKGDTDGVLLAETLLRMSKTQRLKLARRFYDNHGC
jgi:hypothetical protein